MTYSAERIAEIAKIYHELLIERSNLVRTISEGPNAITIEQNAALKLNRIINEYIDKVPEDVQKLLALDIKGFSERLQNYKT